MNANENFYQFDDITLDCENFHVQKDGQNITLTPRAFDVLVFLLQNNGRVVEKQEIFDSVWKDTFVSDNALTKIIKEVRQALKDDASNPRYIETVLKRGYRFISEVEKKNNHTFPEIERTHPKQSIAEEEDKVSERTTQPPHQKPAPRFAVSKTVVALSVVGLISISALVTWLLFPNKPAETPPAPIRSVAVLPFKPLNTDSRDESLEMGMAETLITRLSNLKQIVVRPMSSVRKYTDLQQDSIKAGQELQAEVVLDGSIQKADSERIRVTVRLINVSDGTLLWSAQFDENFADIFKLQDSIANRVTNALALQLGGQEKEQLTKHYTDSPEAYRLYLQGQYLWHRRMGKWAEESLAYYQQALEKDPNFALAYIGAAGCYITLNGQQKITGWEAETKARASIMKALEIDDTLAGAHNALAELKYQYEYDWVGAEKEFRTAIELNPNVAAIRLAYGWFLMSAGRFDEAATEMEKAHELDPSSITINIARGRLFYFSRQYDEAIQHFQNIIAVEPNSVSAHFSLCAVYEQKQMYPEAFEACKNFERLKGMPQEKAEEFRKAFQLSGYPGFLRKRLEYSETMAKTKYVAPSTFALFYSKLGQKDDAFAWFEKTFDERNTVIIQLKIEPGYDILRDDPRYAELVRRIGLQP